jgi:NhaP-type Na+/H+ or K+/H+ antiporter
MALYKLIPALHSWREAVFMGWFGPIGVGAIFYYTVAIECIPEDGPNAHFRALIKPVIYFMVLAIVVAHGVTIPIFYTGTIATPSMTNNNTDNKILHIHNRIGRKKYPNIDSHFK